MASSSSLLSEDQLRCSICLDVFTDPVTTSCGHNFCRVCLKESWDSSSHCQCPVCKAEFPTRPELSVNTFISGLAAQFKKSVQLKSSRAPEKRPSKRKSVICDSCSDEKLEALKSCLDCGVSYCETHLALHKTTPKLKKHKLMDPVENLENYICQKHERPLELFCRDDQTCVCQICAEGDHKTHSTVPIEEESGERKTQLVKTQREVQQKIQNRLKKIEEITHSVELSRKSTEKEKADSVEVFRALVRCIMRNQAELLEVMEEKQKAAERQAEEFIKELEQEITELKRRDTELEQLSHTEDHLHFLQVYPSLCSPPPTKNWTEVRINSHLRVETLRRALTRLQEELSKEMEKMMDVTLDPDSAPCLLILSDDGKQVTFGDERQNRPDTPERFDRCPCVLGKEGFSSGRFYYEVQVSGKTDWDLGVVRQSVNRKGAIKASPEDGYWIVFLRNETEYRALDSPSVPLSLKQAPQKVGVFVDYEEGLVSFFDVEARSHIYSFTGQSFSEKLYPLFSPHLNNGGDHKTHSTVAIEEEIGEKKDQMGKIQAEVQQMIQNRLKKIEEIKHTVELNKKSSEKEKADSVEIFRALLRCIERSQAELLEVMEEKQKAAEKQAKEFIKELEQEITELKRRDTELEQLSHTEDHLHLLQVYPSLCSPPPTKNWTEVRINSQLRVEPLRRALTRLQEELSKEMEKIPEIKIKRIQQHAVDVTLDPDTAHPKLLLSDDGKQVTCGDKRQHLPENPERFDYCVCVLGKEGFSSGRFYYEVQISGKTEWDLGVVRESSNRNGQIKASPKNGYWTIWLRNKAEYHALDSPPVPLFLKQAPQKVGVFVDYEEGLVSFYDVESRSHIYSFAGQSFTEKLYPFFSPGLNYGGKSSAPLIITPDERYT
ncbi:hypothetical protein SRHO_G00030700 [Serrasalmus rhombeus]